MSATESLQDLDRIHSTTPRSRRTAIAVCVGVLALLVVVSAGCTPKSQNTDAAEETATVGAAMAGPVVDVQVTQEAMESTPTPPVLTSPESAVRSFLDWTSYAYRTAQSRAALPVMTTYEEVRVDSYIQYNIQKFRLLDQRLQSITFGRASVEGSRAVVPVRETWTYSYVSIKEPGKVIGGPYEISYEATYTVVNSESGWKVDNVESTALGKVE
ncbi:MAG: hypothetical protein WBI63_07515 [Coriobacteriia bacterium]